MSNAAYLRTFWSLRPPRPRALDFATAFRQAYEEHELLVGLTVLYVLGAAVVLGTHAPNAIGQTIGALLPSFLGNCLSAAMAATPWIVVFLAQHRPQRPISALGRAFYRSPMRPVVLARMIVVTPCISAVLATFSTVKLHIPLFHPFAYDEWLMALDQALHGGVSPWLLLQPVLGFPIVTSLLDHLYYLWFPVACMTFYWQVFARERNALRLQFITAFIVSWILIGSMAALALSSAGPAFVSRLGMGPSPVDGLLDYLRAVDATYRPLASLHVQDMLWQSFVSGTALPGQGISAMPSMHVTIAVLLALFGWRRHWLAGLAYSAFAVVIFLGSVHLGFHYAVDGYIGALMAGALWLASGWLVRRERAGLAGSAANATRAYA